VTCGGKQSVVIITAVTLVGSKLEGVFNYIGSTLDGALQN
jgi:Flp pilus assembly pilin Flp